MASISNERLLAIQHHFHELMRKRAGKFIRKYDITLPELAPLLEPVPESTGLERSNPHYDKELGAYFAVDGMYGGFNYKFKGEGEQAVLVVDSWSRVMGGSGQKHEVTPDGYRLIEKGTV